jgi:hypothetical protein
MTNRNYPFAIYLAGFIAIKGLPFHTYPSPSPRLEPRPNYAIGKPTCACDRIPDRPDCDCPWHYGNRVTGNGSAILKTGDPLE